MRRRIKITALGDPIVIVQRKPDVHSLGHFNAGTGEIVIDPDLPEVGKHIVALHEILHLVDAMMVQSGATKRRVPHDWIISAAPNVLAVLVLAGFWRGVKADELLRFMADEVPAAPGLGDET